MGRWLLSSSPLAHEHALAERVPAARRQCCEAAFGITREDFAGARDFADLAKCFVTRSAAKFCGDPRRHGEEQFVVVATMKRESDGIEPGFAAAQQFRSRCRNFNAREFCDIDDGADVARGAKATEVGG